MSTPILPFAVWQSGTNQNSIPANDNALRAQLLNGAIIADNVTAQPGSPDDGDAYIIPDAATGAQWATFDEFDLAIFQSGTWYAYAPVAGVRVTVAGQLKTWTGTEYEALGGLSDAPSDGTGYVRKDGAWTPESGGGGGASTTQPGECISGLIVTPADGDYRVVVKAPHGGAITEVTTISASGTCTLTTKINTTALGGTANSVSSSEQSQAHSSANTFAAGDDIVLTVSSNSSCSKMTFTIKYTRTLA